MIKEIKYKGYSATPSDYACQDGELSMSLNMVNEDGELHSVTEPEKGDFLGSSNLIEGAPSDFTGKVMLIHHPSASFKNYILLEGNMISAWLTNSLKFEERKGIYTAESGEKIINCEPIGNTLVITTSNGIFYALWQTEDAARKQGSYKYLGKLPETPEFLFMLQTSHPTVHDTYHENWFKEYKTNFVRRYDKEGLVEPLAREHQDALLGDINKAYAEIEKDGDKFAYPFYIRYAYRLYDNTLSKHSSPILLTPSLINPIIDVAKAELGVWHDQSNAITCDKLQCAIHFYFSKLRIYAGKKVANIGLWSDIIKGVEFYITAPIYSYDMSPDVMEYNSASKLRTYSNINAPIKAEGSNPNATTIYQEAFNYLVEEDGKKTLMDIHGNQVSSRNLMLPPLKETFVEDLEEVSSFHYYAELTVEQYENLKDYYGTESAVPAPVKIKIDNLRNITTQRRMTDDFISHQDIVAKDTFVYNNRLHLANIKKTIFKGFPTYSYYTQQIKGVQKTGAIRILVKKSGKTYVVGTDQFKYVDGIHSILQYIYYPDTDAIRIDIFDNNDRCLLSVPMKPHSKLNGAYYFAKLGMAAQEEDLTAIAMSENPYVEESSAVYVSEVNNPFVFESANSSFVGVGEIIALCANTQAISPGQFGDYPLYVFTNIGVWALPVAKDGSYLPAKPVTRDVCLSRESITQIDDGVLFATERGVMMISGGRSICISDFINGKPFELEKLPCADKLKELLGDSYQEITSVYWLEYVKNCRIVYDYVHQHIIVFNPAYKYAYVYSLKDKTWGLIHNNYKYPINDYPSALVVDNENFVQDFSKGTLRKKGLIVTRPLKLDMPNDLKTINSMFQRGVFRAGHVKTVLYGSRDIINWIPVASSVDHALHTVHGTPYKYFRIVLICDLQEDESVYGASIEMRPKMLNKLR